MTKFEVGKIYGENAIRYEVIKRTAKTVTYNVIQHYGRFNQKVTDTKTKKIYNWDSCEVFYGCSDDTVTA